ncbi:MAG: septal ring lytic transglycosylase RlpA family protein [Solirubrobacteraceae bacterium]|nr:septal ring lytic transglycosylase RlpA family protein [Solirubrobacteraceae bacterium]
MRFDGTVGPGASGRLVAIELQPAGGEFTRVAQVRADGSGAFRATWRAGAPGQYLVRAVVGADAAAAQAVTAPTTRAIVYRPAGATWYSLPGNRTACGQVLRRATLGVAHRTLPCGTPVDVTWGGRTITVPVIDRGPFVKGVHYDLTLAAARVLGFVRAGRVRVGVLPATERAPASPLSAVAPGGGADPR